MFRVKNKKNPIASKISPNLINPRNAIFFPVRHEAPDWAGTHPIWQHRTCCAINRTVESELKENPSQYCICSSIWDVFDANLLLRIVYLCYFCSLRSLRLPLTWCVSGVKYFIPLEILIFHMWTSEPLNKLKPFIFPFRIPFLMLFDPNV